MHKNHANYFCFCKNCHPFYFQRNYWLSWIKHVIPRKWLDSFAILLVHSFNFESSKKPMNFAKLLSFTERRFRKNLTKTPNKATPTPNLMHLMTMVWRLTKIGCSSLHIFSRDFTIISGESTLCGKLNTKLISVSFWSQTQLFNESVKNAKIGVK